jgi:hypothetical protein
MPRALPTLLALLLAGSASAFPVEPGEVVLHPTHAVSNSDSVSSVSPQVPCKNSVF